MQVFVFDSVGRTIPTLVDALPDAPIYPLPSGGGVQRIASDSLQKLAGGTKIQRTTDPQALTALAVLNYRETTRFDPLTGRPLLFDEHGAATVEHDQGAVQVFPRINPAVIGLITLAGTERILLGKNGRYRRVWSQAGPGQTRVRCSSFCAPGGTRSLRRPIPKLRDRKSVV